MMSSVVTVQGLLEFFQQLLLAFGEVHRRFHNRPAQQITSRATADRADAFVAQTEQLAGLGLRRNLELYPAIQRWHFQLTTQGGVDDADGHLAVKIATVTGENGMLTNGDLYVKVSRRSSVYTHLTFAGQANTVASINTWRHLDGEGFLLAHPTLAMAALARVLDDLAGAATGRTGLLHGEEALLHPYLPHALTGATGFRAGAFFGATAITGFTFF